MPSLSVVIPTYRRPHILKLCLRHLEAQTIADELEVIVVSDGPDHETKNAVQTCNLQPARPNGRTAGRATCTYLEVPKSQQGVARNFGVRHAHAPFILFIGDDMFLERDACEKHLTAHQSPIANRQYANSPIAVLGFVTWDPVAEITPVMRWLEKSGWQFGYPMIHRYAHRFLPSGMQEHFTYTSNLSVPTEIARRFHFREDVTLYGWEDVEWGLRMKKAGIRLFYEPDAKALHHHHITLEQSLARMETLGTSLVHMARLSPAFRRKMSFWRLALQRMRSWSPTMAGMHRRAFLRGVRQTRGS